MEDGAEDIERFELQYRPGNEEWKNYPEEISGTARSLLLWGRQDVVYEFRLRAVNSAGVAEDYSDKAETFTYILATCIGDDADGGRGIDNKQAGASRATAGVTVKHNWCPAEDVDWVRFDAKAGDSFILRAVPHGTASAAVIQLYAAGSEVLLGEARPVNADSNAVLNWTAPRNGAYAVKLTPADARIVGVEAVYDFTVEKKSSVKPLWFIIFSAMVSGLLGGGYVTAVVRGDVRRRVRGAIVDQDHLVIGIIEPGQRRKAGVEGSGAVVARHHHRHDHGEVLQSGQWHRSQAD